jgi:hypothetical protein
MNIQKLAGAAAATILLTPVAASAASEAELAEVLTTARVLQHRYEEQQRALVALQQRIVELEQQLSGNLALARGRGAPASEGLSQPTAQAVGSVNGGHMPQLAQNAQTLPSTVPAAPAAPQTTTQAQAVEAAQGVALFDRKFTIEQGLTYTHWDRRSLVLSGFLALDSILLGQINLEQIKTDQLQYDITGRWNMTDRISMDLNLPLIYRRGNYISGGAGGAASSLSDASSDTTREGDINLGLYYHLPKAAPADLDWVASVRVRAPTGRHPFGIKLRSADPANDNLVVPSHQPTGNGVWNTSLGLSVIKTLDPVVVFGNVGFGYNFERGFSDLSSTEGTTTPGDVKLGNTFSFGAGLALALNEKTSLSFSYSQLFQRDARLRATGGPWVRQVGTEVNSATFNSSLTYQLSPRLSMVGTASLGLTPDAPDYSIGIKFPYSF